MNWIIELKLLLQSYRMPIWIELAQFESSLSWNFEKVVMGLEGSIVHLCKHGVVVSMGWSVVVGIGPMFWLRHPSNFNYVLKAPKNSHFEPLTSTILTITLFPSICHSSIISFLTIIMVTFSWACKLFTTELVLCWVQFDYC